MIDIHSHILPDVDDGSQSFEESAEMLKASVEDGVKSIVATPHMFSQLSKIKEIEKFRRIFQTFKEKADELNLGIEIFQGSENYLVSGLKEKLKEFPDILTISNGDYFLLEFPMNFIFPGTREFVFDILNEGYIPVICHPERNTDIQANPAILYELLVAGALSQVDAGSIRGDFGSNSKEAANKLLKNNLVHAIASDCHDSDLRPPGLSGVKKSINWIESEKMDLFLKYIPAAIINNEGIADIGPLKDPSISRSVFSIFRRNK
ncbi:MAG: hypothetical protein KAR14_14300 [Candidatus Aminicenantes bacterium]|nr:hypothetical protein [Candidatus Aminicenantes bacterium]